MRPIKFRAWDKRFKKMVYDRPMAILYKNDGDHEIMQFTGLKDKNGKESYHKDIVKRDELCMKFVGLLEWVENTDYDYVHTVNYGFDTIEIPHVTGWMIKLKDGSYETFDPETDEVIGDIYSNPELLEAKE